ncbi:hypothetical protein CDD81_5618 [Ophiocordyceps australis]|uniref:Uncharacterized protein n=1 Tax=Ophiocordyceps australis TaxID=1399860 RepID=A0A2C5Y4K7_9HYPO|nr:hypothetical protein CDD81_5618 [Ophiocordyceps australis]
MLITFAFSLFSLLHLALGIPIPGVGPSMVGDLLQNTPRPNPPTMIGGKSHGGYSRGGNTGGGSWKGGHSSGGSSGGRYSGARYSGSGLWNGGGTQNPSGRSHMTNHLVSSGHKVTRQNLAQTPGHSSSLKRTHNSPALPAFDNAAESTLKTRQRPSRSSKQDLHLHQASPGSSTVAAANFPSLVNVKKPPPQVQKFQPPPPPSWVSRVHGASSAAFHRPNSKQNGMVKSLASNSGSMLQTLSHELDHIKHELQAARGRLINVEGI